MYQIFRNSLGAVDAVNRMSDGATVPYLNANDELTIEMRQWELEHGAIDLSDRLVEPSIKEEQPNYQGFYDALLSEGLTLFSSVRGLAASSLPVNACYTDLVAAIGFEKLPGFQMSITNLVLTMQGIGQPFSNEQIAQIRSLLDANGFKSIVLPL